MKALPPALLHGRPTRTGVIEVMAATVSRSPAATVHSPRRAPGRVLLQVVAPASGGAGETIAEALRGDV